MRMPAVTFFSKDWKPRLRLAALRKVVPNAHDNATELYAKHWCVVVGETETLFRLICDIRMKQIPS